jgi:hypothetical protein
MAASFLTNLSLQAILDREALSQTLYYNANYTFKDVKYVD